MQEIIIQPRIRQGGIIDSTPLIASPFLHVAPLSPWRKLTWARSSASVVTGSWTAGDQARFSLHMFTLKWLKHHAFKTCSNTSTPFGFCCRQGHSALTALSQVAPRELYKSVRKMLGGNYSHAIILTCELSGWEEAQVSKHSGTQAFGCGREPALLHSWLLWFQMWQMFCQCKLLTWKLSRTAQEAMF